jgi:UDP-N-acetyl-D-mannosaminuronic acid dehydrogenase
VRRKIAVVGGCGHVGLPLAIAFAPHHDVIIYDVDARAVEMVRRGQMPFKDKGADEALVQALATGLRATTRPEGLSDCDDIVLVIGTPVDEHLNPSFTVFDRLLRQLHEVLRPGQSVVLRSTVYPGTSQRVQRLLTEHGLDVHVAYCPERVAEGLALEEIRKLPQIVSAFSENGLQAARALFAPLGVKIVELSPLEAELTKLMTNVYRYISFALANQFYMLASDAGVDFYRILHAMKFEYPRAANVPAAGFSAGPCLFKDTMQVAAFNNNQFFLGHAAMLVNEGLPQFLVNKMRARWPDLSTKTVGVLGMAFKAESDDPRESLSYKLRKALEYEAAEVLCSDAYIDDPTFVPAEELVERADIVVIGVPHRAYREMRFPDGKPVVDIWNMTGRGARLR